MIAVIPPLLKRSRRGVSLQICRAKVEKRTFCQIFLRGVGWIGENVIGNVPGFLILVDLYMKPAPLATLYPDNGFWKRYFQELLAGDD